jgi:1-acyl-sn-glycerol-3-phosphate acyltransferase
MRAYKRAWAHAKYWRDPETARAYALSRLRADPDGVRKDRERRHRREAADPEGTRTRRKVRTDYLKAWIAAHPERVAEIKAKWRRANLAAIRETANRRRVRMLQGEIEVVNRLEIYERDGGICGFCLTAVSLGVAFPHPLSPSLDHIIPVALGGSHIKANLRLTHLHCNVGEGWKVREIVQGRA